MYPPLISRIVILSVTATLYWINTTTALDVNGKTYNFAKNKEVFPQLTVFWNDANTTSKTVQFGVEAESSPKGWAAIGFNDDFGMFPARAIVAKAGSGTSAQVLEYFLTASSEEGVTEVDTPVFTESDGELNAADNKLRFVFTIPTSSEKTIKVSNSKTTGIIGAVGALSSSGSLSHHSRVGHVNIQITPQALVGGDAVTDDPQFGEDAGGNAGEDAGVSWLQAFSNIFREQLILAHALLMMISWFLAAPLSILFASPHLRRRLFPSDITSNPRHSRAHKMLTGLLVFFAMIGFIIGLVFIGTKSYTKHLMIGLAVLILMCSQVMLGIWRATIVPLVKPKYLLGRIGKRWKNNLIFFHVWNGRLVWILACANILYGSWLFPDIGDYFNLLVLILATLSTLCIISGPMFGLYKKFTINRSRRSNILVDQKA